MLQLIREKVTGWIAVTIIVLLIIPFAFWGINYYFDQGSTVNAAVVNGSEISLQDYQRAYQNLRQQLQASSGTGIPEEQEEQIKQRSLDALIQRELLRQLTSDAGLRISNSQLSGIIRSLSYFQGSDGFDTAIYEQVLGRQGMSPAAFEEEMRQDLTTQQFQGALTGSEFVTAADVDFIAKTINQNRSFSYAVLSSNDLKDGIEVSEEQIEEFYNNRGEQFFEPEQISVSYIELSLPALAADVTVDEQQLQAYYESNKNVYDIEEQRTFKQVFIPTGEDAGDDDRDQAALLAGELRARIESGTTITELGAEVEGAEQPKFEVSEHGYMIRGIMPQAVDDVMFALAEGEISQPVETPEGIYIIQVEGIMGGTYSTLDDVRDRVSEDYRMGQAETRFYELSDQLANLTFENPDTLEIAAEALDLPIQHSGLFSREQPPDGVLSDPAVLTASFSEEVMFAGNNSEPIELEGNRILVLRMDERKPEQKKPLEEVRDLVITRIKYEQASDMTRKQGDEIIALLRQGTTPDEIGERFGLLWQQASAVRRDDTTVDMTILRTAFRMGHPGQDGTLVSGTQLVSGDYAILRLTGVSQPSTDELKEEEMNSIRTQLENLIATNTWQEFVSGLEGGAKIRKFPDNL